MTRYEHLFEKKNLCDLSSVYVPYISTDVSRVATLAEISTESSSCNECVSLSFFVFASADTITLRMM